MVSSWESTNKRWPHVSREVTDDDYASGKQSSRIEIPKRSGHEYENPKRDPDSYGIYLWHLAVRETCFRIANHFSPAVRWQVAIVLQYVSAIVLGAILTHLIEWPALRVRDRLFLAKDRSHSLIAPPAVSAAAKPVEIVPQPVSLTAEPSA
jgi:hypothetical protein